MDLPQDVLHFIIGLSILVGTIQCFFGYRIFKIVLGLTGFLVGGALGGAIGFEVAQEEIVALVAGLLGGLIGAALLVVLYFIGIFLMGAFLGGLLGAVMFALAESSAEPALLLILAVIAGVIALIFQKLMIIVSTGFGGAWSVVTGIAYFTTGAIDPTHLEELSRSGRSHLYAIVLCWISLGIVGVVVQYKSPPPQRERRGAPPPGKP